MGTPPSSDCYQTHRMPARLSARAPTEKDSESRAEALVAALMDNRRQVDFHILLMMVGLGKGPMAMASNLFFMFVSMSWRAPRDMYWLPSPKRRKLEARPVPSTSLSVQLLVLPESMGKVPFGFFFGQGTLISMH
ncbi:MAG: hypothetical protein Ct9H90mP14_3360 [Methanobacteriota archaeon]|nr:MAG: hypothetical protein Ct9H90mP14_3360 [Euryarchaeota archaeon]